MSAARGAASAARLTRPVELLDRALAWARPALAAVPGHDTSAPTPCAAWDLSELLAHMVDGLTAFIEAAAGAVAAPTPRALPRDPALLAGQLLDLGCGVLGEWTVRGPGSCRVGPGLIATDALVEVAALEVAIHGWDLSCVSTPRRELPPALAAALLPVAVRRVGPADRPGRFGPIVDGAGRGPAPALLNHLGRREDWS
jgi:uncharacterized protein (TIGR03083 family)